LPSASVTFQNNRYQGLFRGKYAITNGWDDNLTENPTGDSVKVAVSDTEKAVIRSP